MPSEKEIEEPERDVSDKEYGKKEPFLKLVDCLDKETDMRKMTIVLSGEAKEFFNDFVVKTGTELYTDGRVNKKRYLVRRCVSQKVNVNGFMGVFFDKAAVDDGSAERVLYFPDVDTAKQAADKMRDYLAILGDERVDMNRSYVYSMFSKKPRGEE